MGAPSVSVKPTARSDLEFPNVALGTLEFPNAPLGNSRNAAAGGGQSASE